ncbi:MAG TPA: YggT family protein [Acidobacteriota bacterium]|nr:YggT family protein [Acidobacteriota bacterium]
MEDDDKLKIDESQKIEQHEAVKGEIRKDVHEEIARSANRLTAKDETEAKSLAGALKGKAIREVSETETELQRARVVARIAQVVDYLFYLAYGLISLDVVLEAIGANRSAGFMRLIAVLSAPLLAPFRGIMPDPSSGRFRFMLSALVALMVYILIHLAVKGLFRVLALRKTSI